MSSTFKEQFSKSSAISQFGSGSLVFSLVSQNIITLEIVEYAILADSLESAITVVEGVFGTITTYSIVDSSSAELKLANFRACKCYLFN